MKIENRLIFETLGVTAVIISLLFVAYELRQANLIALRDSRIQINSMEFELRKLAIENSQFLSLQLKLQGENPELTAEEQVQASNWAYLQLLSWGTASASMEAGLLSDQVGQVWISNAIAVIDQHPGLAPFIDRILKNNGVVTGY